MLFMYLRINHYGSDIRVASAIDKFKSFRGNARKRWQMAVTHSRVHGQWLNNSIHTSAPPPDLREGICSAGHVENLWD
jgi:hypothetical protein